MKINKELQEKILSQSIPEPNSGCWIWLGGFDKRSGYGSIYLGPGLNYSSHRMSYTAFKGPITSGFIILHNCDNPACVNPDHLYEDTKKKNSEDWVKRQWLPKKAFSSVWRKYNDLRYIHSFPYHQNKS